VTRCLNVVGVLFVYTALLMLTGCDSKNGKTKEVAVQTELTDLFVSVNGVRLHVMDWGGSGPDLVLIHGMGDSPRIFDDLACRLTPDFRVIAYARRGHGFSDPVGPFDTGTLVEDLRQLLDSLGIQRANLLGWSMGGNEITAFAGLYPDRTLKLIYLEAGYDWSNPAFLNALAACPLQLAPDEKALRSLDGFRAWARKFWLPDVTWTDGLEAHLREVTRVGEDGTVQPIPGGKISEELFAALAVNKRDYTVVRCPVLALYSPYFFMTDKTDPKLEREVENWDVRMMGSFRRASQERLRRELPDVTIQTLPGTSHGTIGLLNPEKTTEIIRTFLQKK